MDIRIFLTLLMGMNASGARVLIILGAGLLFAGGMFLTKDYLKEMLEDPHGKAKFSVRAFFGIVLQIGAVVFATVGPNAYAKMMMIAGL